MRKKLLSILMATSMVLSAGASFASEPDTSVNVVTEFKTENLIVNGGFENGFDGWTVENPYDYMSVVESFVDDAGATKTAVNGTKTFYVSTPASPDNVNDSIGYVYQEIDGTAHTDYVLNLSWYDAYSTYGSIKVYGDTTDAENCLATVGNLFSGNGWYSSTAAFNSGEHEKLIVKMEFVLRAGATKYAIDNITLKAAGNTQTIDFESGYPEDFNIRSNAYEVTTEKAYTGTHSIKLTSGSGYPIANVTFALPKNRHYAVMFWYYVESGSLGAVAKHAHENGWSGYTTNPIRAAQTLSTKGEWKRAILTPNDGVTGSGNNNFIEIAFQNMALNSVVYIDNIQCRYYDESVDSITITGNNEDGGILHADVKAYNYGYNFEDPVNYQWQRSEDKENWYDVDGATSEDYRLSRADSNKYLRLKVNTTNRYSQGVSDAYYSKAVSISDISYKHEYGSDFGVSVENATFNIDDNGAEAKFDALNKTENALDLSVFVGAYSANGELIDFVVEDYSEIAANETATVESNFEAEGINNLRIIVFDDEMNIYYVEKIENMGSDETENKVVFDKETQEFIITGENKNKPELIIIKNEAEEIEYINAFDCGDKPGFEVRTNIEAGACGKYYVHTSYYDEPVVVIYYSDADYERIINNFMNENVTKEQILESFTALETDDSLLKSLDMDKFANFVNEAKTEVSGADLEEKKENLKMMLEKLSVIEAYNQGIEGLTDKEGKIIYVEELGLSEIDKDGVTIYSVYDSLMNKEGLTGLDKKLKGKDFKNTDEIAEFFKKEVILMAIAYPNVGGSGYVDKVITKENMRAVGIDADKYFEKTTSEKNKTKEKVVKKLFANLNELASELNKKVTTGTTGGGGSSSSGSSGSSGGTGIVLNNTTPVIGNNEEVKPVEEFKFKDVPGNHWAYKYIYALNEINVINGVSDEEFNPEGIVTREQIVKMLCEALDLKKGEKNVQFNDVLSGAWYEKYIEIAASNDVVSGMGDGSFGIGKPVTRQDLCVMAMNAIDLNVNESQVDFNDSEKIADYAKDAVATLSMMKVIAGFSDGTFRPTEQCTRAQAAKIIYEIMEVKEVMN